MSKKIIKNNKMNKEKSQIHFEDTTEYGEFIPSFDAWLPLDEQKKNAEYMENLGD